MKAQSLLEVKTSKWHAELLKPEIPEAVGNKICTFCFHYRVTETYTSKFVGSAEALASGH